MDGKLSWLIGGKEDCTKNVQISAEHAGIKLGTLWSEGRDLIKYTNYNHPENS